MAMQNFLSQANVTLHRIDWKIEHFALVARNQDWLDLQSFEFEVPISVDGRVTTLKWKLCVENCKDDKKWISAWMTVLNCPDSWKGYGRAFTQSTMWKQKCSETFHENGISANVTQKLIHSSLAPKRSGWRNWFNLDSDWNALDEDGSLCTTLFIRLIILPPPENAVVNVGGGVQSVLKNFHAVSAANAKADLQRFLLNPQIPFSEVKIVTKDEKGFVALWGVLAARSPYFAKMYETNMIERGAGIIHVKNISGKTMEVLGHFIYSGELLPAWKEDEVIVELTHAAAMYEFKDLLGFLDEVFGEICSESTSFQLLSLARKLSLKRAEESVLNWIKKNIANSTAEGLFSIMERFATTEQD